MIVWYVVVSVMLVLYDCLFLSSFFWSAIRALNLRLDVEKWLIFMIICIIIIIACMYSQVITL